MNRTVHSILLASVTLIGQLRPVAAAEQLDAQMLQQVRNALRAADVQNVRALPFNVRQNAVLNQQFNARNAIQSPSVHEPFDGTLSSDAIRTAVDDALMYLRAQQQPDGSIGEVCSFQGGATALATLAMLAAGAHPASDVSVQRAIDYLLKLDVDSTYMRAMRANVWEYALRQVPYDERIRTALKTDFDWMMKALGNKQGWRYYMRSTDWDNSVTQYGVLGVWAATRAGFEPGDAFWVKMSKHFRSCQNPDGGWGYQRGGSSANMATAGLATMFLVFDKYHGKSYYTSAKPNPFAEGAPAECLRSIQRCMDWLGKRGGSNMDGYYLYGIERTGVASGRKRIGGRDWFAEGAAVALRQQRGHGAFSLSGHGNEVVRTSFCTLFLVYGGAPVAFNKLEYGAAQDWNLNPRDLANLTKELWSAYERPLNWHTVSIQAGAEELEAPILFISGSHAAQFDEGQTAKLRDYVDRGGTILAEPSDHSAEFADSMEKLVRDMYPEDDYPGRGLVPLSPDHGVFTVLKQTWKDRPRVLGASNGSRTFFFLSREYMSADWQMNRADSDAFKFATNLLFYATDLGSPRPKYASILPRRPAAEPRDLKVDVARAIHGVGSEVPRDWDAASAAWGQLGPYVRHTLGCELAELPPVRLDDPDALTGVQLLHLTGRRALRLTDAERNGLRNYVRAGGTVLIDSCAGSADFARSAKREVEALFGALSSLDASDTLTLGQFGGGQDLSRAIKLTLPARQLLRAKGESPRGQKLLVARHGGRPAVLVSEFDVAGSMAGIANYRALAYKPASARAIVGNILAYIMAGASGSS